MLPAFSAVSNISISWGASCRPFAHKPSVRVPAVWGGPGRSAVDGPLRICSTVRPALAADAMSVRR
jgi:hypothetical protein